MPDAKLKKGLIVDQTSVWSNVLPRRDSIAQGQMVNLTARSSLSGDLARLLIPADGVP
jgi:hypothetical protein